MRIGHFVLLGCGSVEGCGGMDTSLGLVLHIQDLRVL